MTCCMFSRPCSTTAAPDTTVEIGCNESRGVESFLLLPRFFLLARRFGARWDRGLGVFGVGGSLLRYQGCEECWREGVVSDIEHEDVLHVCCHPGPFGRGGGGSGEGEVEVRVVVM